MIKSRTSWVYKFFWCQKVGKTVRCQYQIKHANYWIPRSFIWSVPEQNPDLHAYIDAVTEQRATDAQVWEDNGKVSAVEREEPPANVEVVRVSALLLCSILRGEYPLHVPATARLSFTDTGNASGHYVTAEAMVAMVCEGGAIEDAYIKKIRDMSASGKPILYLPGPISDRKLKEWHVSPYLPNTNLKEAAAAFGELNEESPSFEEEDTLAVPAKDTELSCIDHGSHVETISMINDRETYYCRRLLRDNVQFWCGTSFHPNGPWHVFEQDYIVMNAVEQECAV